MDLIKGVDISVIQGVVDFDALFASGVQFVICRCGVGNGSKDKLYDQNIAKAKAAGLKVMAYNFVYPLPPLASQPSRDPKVQAKMHVEWTAGEQACCDLEWPAVQDWTKWGCTPAQIVQWSITYLEEYERLSGIRPIVYTYPNFADSIHLPTEFGQKYKLWIASYTATPRVPKPWTDWVMWQDSGGTWKLPNGVACDTDKAKDLSLWDEQQSAPVEITVPAPLPDVVPVAQPTAPPASNSGSVFSNIWQTIGDFFNKK